MTFTKLEGTGYLFIIYIVFLSILCKKESLNLKNKIQQFIYFLLPSFSICFAFHLYKYLIGIANIAQRTELIDPNEILFRFITTCKVFIDNFFLTGNWSLIWLLLVMSFFLRSKRLENREEIRLTALTLGMFVGLYFLMSTFTATFNFIAGKMTHVVLSRIILHFFPLAPILIALLTCRKSNNEQKPTP